MRGALTCLAAAVTLALAASAAADGGGGALRTVEMPGKLYVPASLDVLVGDTVQWRNGDLTNHTVSARDDSFESGLMPPGATFSHTFPRTGTFAYTCTIHKFMQGSIRVVAAALSGPAEPVVSGGRVTLRGLVRADAAAVAVERKDTSGWTKVREVVPNADGSFTVGLRVLRPETYRARAANGRSAVVRVHVAPGVRAAVRGRAVDAVVRPARPGARVVLQRLDLDRFAWVTVRRGVVDRSGRAHFTLDRGRGAHVRVVVRGGRDWADGASPAVVLR